MTSGERVIRVFLDQAGEWRVHEVALPSEEVTLTSEGYSSKENAIRAARSDASEGERIEVQDPETGDFIPLEGREG